MSGASPAESTEPAEPAEPAGPPPLSLADLIRPLPIDAFLRDHWQPGEAHLSAPAPHLLERLAAAPALRDPAALTTALAARPRAPNLIDVFGPNSFRSEVPAARAMDFYRAGFTLYMAGVEQVAPEAAALFTRVYAELGFLPRVHIEAFAAAAGSVSSWHYDHDINFQILLSGEKEWAIAPNTHIRNPISAFHPTRGPDGAFRGRAEEVYARDPALPDTPLPGCRRLRAVPGTVMFLPRAYWHEVRSLTDCFGVNLVIKGKSWAAAIAAALQYRLEAHEELRGYVAGLATAHTLPQVIEEMERGFPSLRELALRELGDLALEEVPLTESNLWLRWAPEAQERRLVQRGTAWVLELPALFEEPVDIDADLAPFVARLVGLQGSFTWSQLLSWRGELGATHVRALLETLREHEILVPAR